MLYNTSNRRFPIGGLAYGIALKAKNRLPFTDVRNDPRTWPRLGIVTNGSLKNNVELFSVEFGIIDTISRKHKLTRTKASFIFKQIQLADFIMLSTCRWVVYRTKVQHLTVTVYFLPWVSHRNKNWTREWPWCLEGRKHKLDVSTVLLPKIIYSCVKKTSLEEKPMTIMTCKLGLPLRLFTNKALLEIKLYLKRTMILLDP